MSWDVVVFLAPAGVARMDEIPDDYERPVIGSREQITDTITYVAESVDATDPGWLQLQGRHHRIEVNLGQDLDVDSFTFIVRGGAACGLLMRAIAEELGTVLLDTSTGELMPLDPDKDALKEWESHRDGG